MILISHRGNVSGRIEETENRPDYIDDTIRLGYDVEVDIWAIEDTFYLGHDKPQYVVSLNWLHQRKDKLWIHCKNIKAVEEFNNLLKMYNYFWHQEDIITLTSKEYIWAYPGKQPIENSIAVMPELFNDNISKCIGICSDHIQKYNIYNYETSKIPSPY
jgi:hypothetical protein